MANPYRGLRDRERVLVASGEIVLGRIWPRLPALICPASSTKGTGTAAIRIRRVSATPRSLCRWGELTTSPASMAALRRHRRRTAGRVKFSAGIMTWPRSKTRYIYSSGRCMAQRSQTTCFGYDALLTIQYRNPKRGNRPAVDGRVRWHIDLPSCAEEMSQHPARRSSYAPCQADHDWWARNNVDNVKPARHRRSGRVTKAPNLRHGFHTRLGLGVQEAARCSTWSRRWAFYEANIRLISWKPSQIKEASQT